MSSESLLVYNEDRGILQLPQRVCSNFSYVYQGVQIGQLLFFSCYIYLNLFKRALQLTVLISFYNQTRTLLSP